MTLHLTIETYTRHKAASDSKHGLGRARAVLIDSA